VEFRILGPLEVLEDGRPLALGGSKQCALLAILLLHANEVVSRDRLIDALWGASPPETSQTALQVHVSQLRKILGRDAIVTRAPGYLIRVEDGELDVERFERLVETARGQEPAATSELLREALGLWRGPPLAEVNSVASAGAERARLDEERLAALEQRVAADLELGRHVELVPELEGLVREHPVRERLRGQLMLALYRCGRQADALEVYRTGRRLLDEELGLEPGQELRRLERAILEQEPSLAASAAPARASALTGPAGTVTFLFTDIEGSTRLTKELGDDYDQLLEQHDRLLREAFGGHRGEEIDSQGDAFFFAFRRARDAVRAAVEVQQAFAALDWPQDVDVRIRIGIHTGEPGFAEAGYSGLDVVRAARISGSAHGGQVLVSSATRDLVGTAVEDVSFYDLGAQRLKDIEQPERIFQVVAPGLAEDFPPPMAEDAARMMTIGGREMALAAAAEAALGAEERRARLFRRAWLVAALGALILAGAVAGLVVALMSASGGLIAVAPDAVAVLDPKTNRVIDAVAVGSRPVALAVGENAVWVANADDGTVSRIDPESREVVKVIGVGAPVSDIAAGEGSVWVANGSEGTLARIDPRTNTVVDTLDLSGPDKVAPAGVYSVAIGNGAVWIGSGARKVIRIDPDTTEIVATIRMAQTPADVAVEIGAVWTAYISGRVLRIEPEGNAVTGAVAATASPVSIAIGGGTVWVSDRDGLLWRIDPATMSVVGTVSIEGVLGIASGGGAIWAAGGATGLLHRIDARSGQVARVIRVGSAPLDVAVGEEIVWVAVGAEASS
jgi:YVTN family beta-propeller protein